MQLKIELCSTCPILMKHILPNSSAIELCVLIVKLHKLLNNDFNKKKKKAKLKPHMFSFSLS